MDATRLRGLSLTYLKCNLERISTETLERLANEVESEVEEIYAKELIEKR